VTGAQPCREPKNALHYHVAGIEGKHERTPKEGRVTEAVDLDMLPPNEDL